MPDTKPREQWTADDYRERTVEARRQARYKFAADRIKRIIDGSPPLTDDQRAGSRSCSTAAPVNDETRPRGPGSGSVAHQTNADACMVADQDDDLLLDATGLEDVGEQ